MTAKIQINAAKNGWVIQHTPLELLDKSVEDLNPNTLPEPDSAVFNTMEEVADYLKTTFPQ